MPRFEPQPGQLITLGLNAYEVMPHPGAPNMAYGQEGRKAIIYQLRGNNKLYALKVFKEAYRKPYLVNTCRVLARLTSSGLEVCARECLTSSSAGAILRQYPDLEYAVLMPWMDGTTWYDIILSRTPIHQNASLRLAARTVEVLANLERQGYAHCDVSGTNVIVNPVTGNISFIDVEDMFGPGFALADSFPQGTDGYQHRACRTSVGQWCAEGDRFAAAVLLAEMLVWHDIRLRRASEQEHYFDEADLHDTNCSRYKLIIEALSRQSRLMASYFERAWNSRTLKDCPALGEWLQLIKPLPVAEWLPIQPPPVIYIPWAGKYTDFTSTQIPQAKAPGYDLIYPFKPDMVDFFEKSVNPPTLPIKILSSKPMTPRAKLPPAPILPPVVPPTAPSFSRVAAGNGARFVAYLLDSIICTGLGVVAAMIIWEVASRLAGNLLGSDAATAVLLLSMAILNGAYYVYPHARTGQTWAKKWLRIKVVDETGRLISSKRALGRWVVFMLPVLISMISGSLVISFLVYLWPLFNAKHRALHDVIARTYVVKV